MRPLAFLSQKTALDEHKGELSSAKQHWLSWKDKVLNQIKSIVQASKNSKHHHWQVADDKEEWETLFKNQSAQASELTSEKERE